MRETQFRTSTLEKNHMRDFSKKKGFQQRILFKKEYQTEHLQQILIENKKSFVLMSI